MKQSTQSIRHRNNNAKQRGKRWKCGTILLYGTILSLGLFLLVLHHSIGHIILLQQENKQTEKLLPFLGKTGAEMKKKKTQKVVGNTSEGEKDKKNRYHLVFSTSCKNIDWQSYLFFYLAHAHKQAGEITSIVSGCASEEEEEEIRQLHQERFANAMNPNFHIHITPDFSIRTKYQQTKYWNKPFGLKHWMEHRFGFKYDLEKGDVAETTEYDDDVSFQ